MTADWTKHLFFDLGSQYYVAARFAVIAGKTPVCGNLYHHAIEMFLKGQLSESLTEADLTNLQHKLLEIWERFKQEFPHENLSQFDATIRTLDKFEKIRYPQRIEREGMLASITWEPPAPTRSSTKSPRYSVHVPDLDTLVDRLFELCSRNPQDHLQQDKLEGQQILRFENPFYKKWFPSDAT